MQVEITATKKTYLGLFFVALATLMYEILLTRIFSVTMWYHFAFVAVSVAMFGLSVGGIVVYLFPGLFTQERTRQHLTISALLFAATVIISFVIHLRIPFLADESLAGLASVALTYVVISVPFFFSGTCVCLVLTRFSRQVSKLYAADLAGAALGCILLLYVLDFSDGPATMLVVAFLASLGAVCFSRDIPLQKLRRMAWVYSLLFLAFAGVQTVSAWNGRPFIRIVWAKGQPQGVPLYEKWNSFSRIRVYGDGKTPEKPFGWGLSTTYPPERKIRQLTLDIDSNALTVLTFFDGDYEPLDFLKYEVTNLAHYIRGDGQVLVVGAGAGRDVLSALVFGQKSVVGLELNQNILDAVNSEFGDFTGHLHRLPGVTFVQDEARSYMARSQDRFDIIQISMIDTWAATAAGAFVLAEHSLYTLEGWRIFLEHLAPNGVLTVSRWNFGDRPGEVYRLVSLASAALSQWGVRNPREHMVIVRRMGPRETDGVLIGVATLLVSQEPFSEKDLNMLEEVSQRMQFEVVLSPRFALDSTFAALANGEDPERHSARLSLNLAPPTDDSPFFFQMLRPRDVIRQKSWEGPEAVYNLKAVRVLGALLVTVIVLTILCILLPLSLKGKKESLQGALPLFVFFSAIGLGFMLVEISQMQRLIVFLGHPSYALSVVLFALLLSSGLGSLFTERIGPPAARRRGLLPLLLLIAALFLFGMTTPQTLSALQGSTTPLRILVATAILFPVGFFMGMAFPIGMKVASTKASSLTPWLWGMNGATSVCASVLAVVIALSYGISASFWTGFFSYCVALVAFLSTDRAKA